MSCALGPLDADSAAAACWFECCAVPLQGFADITTPFHLSRPHQQQPLRIVHSGWSSYRMSTIAHSLRDYRSPTRPQLFAHAFSLPAGESPIVDAEITSAVLSLSAATKDGLQEDQVYAGRLTLTQSFLCFASQGDRGRSCRMNLPLWCVPPRGAPQHPWHRFRPPASSYGMA
ncbi:hypothetical protein L1887_52030 [Cichorium endivia]|nr:hypothetical protein L1887_52030 [Cichorium endivia]